MTKALVAVYLIGLVGCLLVSGQASERPVGQRSTKELVEGDQTFRGLAALWTSAFAFLCLEILLRG
jgi:hypothetical protein